MFAFAILVTIVFGTAIVAVVIVGIIDEHNQQMKCQHIRDENQALRIANSK